MPKHTPGQWQASGVRTRIGGEPMLTVNGPSGVIAYIPYGDGSDHQHIQAHADQFLIASGPDLADSIRDKAAWLRHRLESQVHVSVKDYPGNVVDGFAAIQIPVWEARQKLAELDEDIAKAEGKSTSEVKPMGSE